MTLILFDCESFIYRAVTACKILKQCETDRFIFGEYWDLRKGMDYFNNQVDTITQNLRCNDIILVVGDKDNWRKEYCKTYKAQRQPTPEILYYLKQEILNNYEWVSLKNLEADDTCRIMYEDMKTYPCRKIIAAIDKDFKTFPCELYNPDKNELVVINKQEAEFNLMKQVIMGDTCDNYKGIPGYGEVTTSKFLNAEPRIWEDVKELYRENKLHTQYLTNKNLATLVGIDRYNFNTGEVKLIVE